MTTNTLTQKQYTAIYDNGFNNYPGFLTTTFTEETAMKWLDKPWNLGQGSKTGQEIYNTCIEPTENSMHNCYQISARGILYSFFTKWHGGSC